MNKLRTEFEKVIMEMRISEDLSHEEEVKQVSQLYGFSQSITPENLYRYRTCSKRHFEAFKNDQLLLAKPTTFNDPYDALIFINKKAMIKQMSNTNTQQTYQHFTNLLNDHEYKQREIKKMGKEFVETMLNNWTKDGQVIKLSKTQIENSIKVYSNQIEVIVDASIKALKQSSLIACFSENINSILMWSHYSNNHTGFALNYDLKSYYSIDVGLENVRGSHFVDKKLFPVIYSNKRLDATEYAIYNFLYNQYVKMGIPFPYGFYDKLFYYKFLLYKSKNWEYEQEWRIIKQTNLDVDDNKPNYIYIDNMKPKELYLGSQITLENKQKLIKIARRKNIEVFQMKINSSEMKYKLSFEKID